MPETTAARPPATSPSRLSTSKREAILRAAEQAFLREGFVGTNVDEIAALARVSKPTVYRHFGSKEALFVALVSAMTTRAGDGLHDDLARPGTVAELEALLTTWARRQLATVLTPRLMQVRRLVIGEVARFPELARALHDAGPRRAVARMTTVLAGAHDDALLHVLDPAAAADRFNWLVMGGPVNRAMLLGDAEIPGATEQHRHARACVQMLLAAHAVR